MTLALRKSLCDWGMWLLDAHEPQAAWTKSLARGIYCLLIHRVDASIPTPNLFASKSGVVQARSHHLPNEIGCLLSAKLSMWGCSAASSGALSKDLHEHGLFTSAFSLHWWSSHVSQGRHWTGIAFRMAAGVAQSQSHVFQPWLHCVTSREKKPNSAFGSSLALPSQLCLYTHFLESRQHFCQQNLFTHDFTTWFSWKMKIVTGFAKNRLTQYGNILRPESRTRMWKAADLGLLWTAVQMQMHPPHADFPERTFKGGADYGHGKSALDLCEGMRLWGPCQLFIRDLLTAGCPWAWDVCHIR